MSGRKLFDPITYIYNTIYIDGKKRRYVAFNWHLMSNSISILSKFLGASGMKPSSGLTVYFQMMCFIKDPLRDLIRKPSRRWENNIIINLYEIRRGA